MDLPKVEELYNIYRELNKRYFNNTLPTVDSVTIEWSNRLSSSAGVCYPKSKIIRLSSAYHKKFPNDIGSTLLHEMIHLKVRGHGPRFIREINRIKKQGGEVSRYSREAAKEPRWEYICKKCNISIKKYKRYPRNIICGRCRGKLEEKQIVD